jgi:hypothetical protein
MSFDLEVHAMRSVLITVMFIGTTIASSTPAS